MRILCLDYDSLHPDHLGCYDYPRNISSNIDAIAEVGGASKTGTPRHPQKRFVQVKSWFEKCSSSHPRRSSCVPEAPARDRPRPPRRSLG